MAHKFMDIGMGVILIQNDLYGDDRGFMAEWYNKDIFSTNGITNNFVQHKASRSKKGVLRGFHFQQHPYEQAKIIRCLSGEIFNVVVDVRKESATFKKHIEINLRGDGKSAIFLPKGFANGFIVTSDEDAIILYYIDGEWVPDKECGIIWDDPDLAIKWPMVPSALSKRDAQLPKINDIKWE